MILRDAFGLFGAWVQKENKYCTVILIILNTFKTRKLPSALDIS